LSINEELKRGIQRAAGELDQSDKLSQRLIAWLNEMGQRELTKQEHSRHLVSVQSAVDTSNIGEDDES